jgi:hypothetical protein
MPASPHPPPLPVTLPLLGEAPAPPVALALLDEAPPLPLALAPVGWGALGLLHEAATSATAMPERSHALVVARRFAPARMRAPGYHERPLPRARSVPVTATA